MSILFVDESKAKGYTMVATVVVAGDLTALRRDVRALVFPGQRRIHFTKEGTERKKAVLSRFIELGIQSQVFHCATKDQVVGREMCIAAIVKHAVERSCRKVVIERDESIERADRRTVFREVRRHHRDDSLLYEFTAPHQEPLLWVADAIAWSYAKGGDWRRRVQPLIAGVTELTA